MVISGVIAFVGLVLPYVIVPMRRNAGLPTYQWDADTSTNPVRLARRSFVSSRVPALRSPLPPSPPFPPACAPAQYISEWSEYDRKHTFDNPSLVAQWAKSGGYRYHDALAPTDAQFPCVCARAPIAPRRAPL